MELTLDQALQRGIEAHRAGKVEEADSYYTAILKANPKHPDANHNLAVLAVGVGKVETALPFFKIALEANTNVAQYWQSYIEALIRLGRMADAKEVFDQAKNKGLEGDSFDQIEKQLGSSTSKNSNATEPPQEQLENLINLYTKGQYKAALNRASQVLEEFPQSIYLYNIIGAAKNGLGKPEEAIESFKKALSIEPDLAEAYYNIGNALKGQLKLEEAIEAFKKALSKKPDYAKAYSNMGNALQEQGKLEKAIEAYNTSLSIKPDFAEVWNNLYFSLQALKPKISPAENINLLYPKDIKSNYAKIELSILDYKLHRGQESEGIYLDNAISNLSNADDIIIRNPTFDKNAQEKVQTVPDKIVTLVHFGRSGTGLMHSLIDGHPKVSTLPSIYFSEYFDHSSWIKIISAGWNGIVDQFASIYDVLFDSTSSVPIVSKSKKLLYNIGKTEGMVNVGEQKNEVLHIDKDLFKKELKRLVAGYHSLDAFVFFNLVHLAYDRALNDFNSKSLIFYHIHNPDTYAKLNFTRLNPNTNWLIMIREPIQSCESWIKGPCHEKDYFNTVNRILAMLFEIDDVIYSKQNTIGVRLEDLKIKPVKTIRALCNWMGIEEHEQLYKMTAQGKKWWGDPNSPYYEKNGHEPFGSASIEQKVGSIFSKRDQFIISTLFYPFSVRFGYVTENSVQFKADLQTIRPLIDQTFDFEKKIMEQISSEIDRFINSGPYTYFRSGLIERWNTLNKFQTYPNMIRSLKI